MDVVLHHSGQAPAYTPALKGKHSPYLTTKRGVPQRIPVLGSQPAGDVSHKPGGRLPLLSTKKGHYSFVFLSEDLAVLLFSTVLM